MATLCRRCSLRDRLLIAVLIVATRQGLADDAEPADGAPNAGATAILQVHLAALKVSVAGSGDNPTWQVIPQALLKYNDPARRYLAGGVWRIGKSGRPKGLVVLELWPDGAGPRRGKLHHELSSFQSGGLELTSSTGISWRPRKSVLDFKPLSHVPRPAPTAKQRLRQMKQLAREFAIEESYQGDVSVLRLLPRPIDRYEDPNAGIDDGAMFAFTYGTNPELVLLLECDGDEWQFALARLSWAELNVQRDGELLQVLPELSAPAPHDPYTPQTVTVLLPQPQ